jgi:hypothetical protein
MLDQWQHWHSNSLQIFTNKIKQHREICADALLDFLSFVGK